MTFQYQGGGIIEDCLGFYVYETPKHSSNQQTVAVDGKWKSDIVNFVEEKLYIADWIHESNREKVMERIYNVETGESKFDPGYYISGKPNWENVAGTHTLPIYMCTLIFRKG